MSLTLRQAEIACLVARGRTYKSIASELGISVETVQKHVVSAADRLPGRGSPKIKLILFVLNPADGTP